MRATECENNSYVFRDTCSIQLRLPFLIIKLVYLSEGLDNLVFIVEFLIIIGMQMLVIYLSRGLIR